MAATGIDSQRHLGKKRRRNVRIKCGKSSLHFKELLHRNRRGDAAQFFIFRLFWCYTRHLAAPRRHSSTKDTQLSIEEEKFDRKKKIRQRKENFYYLFYLFSHASRHGHSATGAATVKARSATRFVEHLRSKSVEGMVQEGEEKPPSLKSCSSG